MQGQSYFSEHGGDSYEPTSEEIELATEEIRRGWSTETFILRAIGPQGERVSDHWDVPIIETAALVTSR